MKFLRPPASPESVRSFGSESSPSSDPRALARGALGPRGAWRFAMQADDEYNADIEAALDTSDEMSVGDALRRRRAHKDKRSIAKMQLLQARRARGSRRAPCRTSSADADPDACDGRGGSAGAASGSARHHPKRRVRRHSYPGFALGDGVSDGVKLERLNGKLEAMLRRLPRGSWYARQIEIIQKAMEICSQSGVAGGGARTAPENDELSRLLAAVSL